MIECFSEFYVVKKGVHNMLFYYLRHGDPVYDPDSLTELGLRQAEALGKRLAMHGIDEIYASTSKRAIETAKPISEILKLNITQLDWCHENYAWRDLTVMNDGKRQWGFQNDETIRLFNSKKVKDLREKWYDVDELKGTSFKEGILRIQREADNFFESLGYRHIKEEGLYLPQKPNDKRIAMFAHEGFGLAFLSCVLDIPYPEFSLHFGLSLSAMTVIDFSETNGIVIPKVVTMSNDSHIYKEGLPTKFCNCFYI